MKRLIDLSQPVGALFVSVMHCIPDSSDPAAVLRGIIDRLPSGSFLVINQLVSEDKATRDFVTEFMAETTQNRWGRVRQAHEVERFFDGLEVLEPGLGEINDWRPDSDLGPKQLTDEWYEFGGVARKP